MQIEAKRIRTAKELSKILEAQAKTVKGFTELANFKKESKSFDMRERVFDQKLNFLTFNFK